MTYKKGLPSSNGREFEKIAYRCSILTRCGKLPAPTARGKRGGARRSCCAKGPVCVSPSQKAEAVYISELLLGNSEIGEERREEARRLQQLVFSSDPGARAKGRVGTCVQRQGES